MELNSFNTDAASGGALQKEFLKTLWNSQENNSAKKRLWHWYFPVNFAQIFKTTFL